MKSTKNPPSTAEMIQAWLRRMDLYLWGNAISPTQASALAQADGIQAGVIRLGRQARVVCRWWRQEGKPRIGRTAVLGAKEWSALMQWVRRHAEALPSCGSLQAACRYARHCGVRCSPATLREALRAAGITPAWSRPGFRIEEQP